MAKADLHAHTTASDGVLTPVELVNLAMARDLTVLAVTDHDSTEGVAAALEQARGTTLEVWPGVEISADIPGSEIHVLGYFVDYHDPTFQRILHNLRESRYLRAQRMVEKLGALGMPIEFERVLQLAGTGAVGRPHIAQALVERGYVASVREAFERYLGRTGPAYVERYKLTPAEAVRLIRTAGGLASLAHPIYIGAAAQTGGTFSLDAILPELLEAGLGGIEVYYPDFPPELTEYLTELCVRHNLIPTGGSDFHGGGQGADLGSITIPESTIERMRQWRDTR